MKNQIIQSLKVIVLALVLSLGLSFVFAQSPFNPPPGGPSASTNTEGPINVGTAAQIKNGNLSVNAFLATLNSQFSQNVSVGKNLNVSGDALLNQNLTVNSNLVLNSFNSSTRESTGQRSLCINDGGQIILCSEASCGTLHSTYIASAPISTTPGLCATGNQLVTNSIITKTTEPIFNWTCSNTQTSQTANCFAYLQPTCGSAQNATFVSYPTQNPAAPACATGTISNMSLHPSSGMVNWECITSKASSGVCSAYSRIPLVQIFAEDLGISTTKGSPYHDIKIVAVAYTNNMTGSSIYFKWDKLNSPFPDYTSLGATTTLYSPIVSLPTKYKVSGLGDMGAVNTLGIIPLRDDNPDPGFSTSLQLKVTGIFPHTMVTANPTNPAYTAWADEWITDQSF